MKSWTWPLACAVLLLLSLWGFWGEGTASKLLPEKAETVSSTKPKQVAEKESVTLEDIDEEKPVKRYDATLHVRAKPLPDPFHLEAIQKAKQPKAVETTTKAPVSKKATVTKEAPTYASEPTLRGIMAFGSEKRAIIEYQGQSMTMREGESRGPWKVSSIGEKTVTLTGSSGVIKLSTP